MTSTPFERADLVAWYMEDPSRIDGLIAHATKLEREVASLRKSIRDSRLEKIERLIEKVRKGIG